MANYKKTVSGSTYWGVDCFGYVGGIAAIGKNISNSCFFGTVYASVDGSIYGSGNKFLGSFDETNETDYICCKYYNGTNNYNSTNLNKEALQNALFIKNTLKWDESIWYLQDGQYPKLRFELK